jgi:hypothetical protein
MSTPLRLTDGQFQIAAGPGRDELHSRALHRLRDGLRVAEVVLLPSREGTHIFVLASAERRSQAM